MNYEALFLNAYELRYLPVRTSYGKAPFVFVFFCFIWNIRKARWDSVGRKGAVMVVVVLVPFTCVLLVPPELTEVVAA